MDEPKSIGEVFEKLGFGGDNLGSSSIDAEQQPAEFDKTKFEVNFSREDTEIEEAISPLIEPLTENTPEIALAEPVKEPDARQDGVPLDKAVSSADKNDTKEILESITQVGHNVEIIAEASQKTASEIREMHKLYHNEFANRLKSMQDELDQYRERDKGRIFDEILGNIAKLYSDNESVAEDIPDEKLKKRVRYMFMDILQILEANGVEKLKSNPGDKRNTRHCQIIERIPTSDPSLHDTIEQSRGTGFFVENRSLVKEFVNVYLYKEPNTDVSSENLGGNLT